MPYNGYTESRKKANLKYLSSIAEIRLRVSHEEKKEIERKAHESGKSVNQYVKDKVMS